MLKFSGRFQNRIKSALNFQAKRSKRKTVRNFSFSTEQKRKQDILLSKGISRNHTGRSINFYIFVRPVKIQSEFALVNSFRARSLRRFFERVCFFYVELGFVFCEEIY